MHEVTTLVSDIIVDTLPCNALSVDLSKWLARPPTSRKHEATIPFVMNRHSISSVCLPWIGWRAKMVCTRSSHESPRVQDGAISFSAEAKMEDSAGLSRESNEKGPTARFYPISFLLGLIVSRSGPHGSLFTLFSWRPRSRSSCAVVGLPGPGPCLAVTWGIPVDCVTEQWYPQVNVRIWLCCSGSPLSRRSRA